MDDFKSLVEQYTVEDYGKINVKLAELLKRCGITRNRLSTLTGVKYDVICRYFANDTIYKVDLDVLSKICFVLDCKIEDILEYEPPEQTEKV